MSTKKHTKSQARVLSADTRRASWKERLRARGQLHKATTAALEEYGSRNGDVDDEGDADLDMLPVRQWWGRLAKQAMWGPPGVKTPLHETSTARVGVLTPFVAGSTANIPGPAIGIDTHSGAVFCFDPWGAYAAGLVTSPGVVVFGMMGSGKSMCVKIVILRLIKAGRHVIVQSDPKGEWVKVAEVVGGIVIRIGPGTGTVVNPLDEGQRPADVSEDEWRHVVEDRRGNALRSIVSILRPGQPLTPYEHTTLDLVVASMTTGNMPTTIAGVVGYLGRAEQGLVDYVGADAPRELSLILGRLVTGPMSGMFDGPSNVHLDPASPMTVMDTSVLRNAAPEVRSVGTACISAWIDATLRSKDGRFRMVVSEEGWDELRNPYQVAAMDERLRMAGDWGVSNWLIFHELADQSMFGEADSSHRNQVAGIISKSPIKIVFNQSQESMPLFKEMIRPTPDELELVTRLPQGVGLWRIGADSPVLVHAVVTPTAYPILNTDKGRAG